MGPERRIGGFTNLLTALQHARAFDGARLSWFNAMGALAQQLSYAQLHDKVQAYACVLQRMAAIPAAVDEPGPRVGIVADTGSDFLAVFCACHCLGWVPCPVPVPTPMQGAHYTAAMARLQQAAGMALIVGPAPVLALLQADTPQVVASISFEALQVAAAHTTSAQWLPPVAAEPEHIAYVQFSSGSTGTPKGIAISHRALMHNVDSILLHGMQLGARDRAFSWLPYYHDMGLVGFVLAPLCAQVPVDYIAPSAIVRRPHIWPALMAQRASTIAYAPSFAWQLAAKGAAHLPTGATLQALRIAGVGGDYVDYAALQAFAQAFAGHGFDANAFKPSYGLAEATLAVSMSHQPFAQLQVHYCIAPSGQAVRSDASSAHSRPLVNCGAPLPGWALQVQDTAGQPLPPDTEGDIVLQGPAQLSGTYQGGRLQHLPANAALHTGDKGFVAQDGSLYITGRSKDLLVVRGRNLWPQDIEAAVHENAGVPLAHQLLLQSRTSPSVAVADGLVLLVHEKAVRRSEADIPMVLARIASAAGAASGVRVVVCMVPNGSIQFTSSGKKARAASIECFESGQTPVLARSDDPRFDGRDLLP